MCLLHLSEMVFHTNLMCSWMRNVSIILSFHSAKILFQLTCEKFYRVAHSEHEMHLTRTEIPFEQIGCKLASSSTAAQLLQKSFAFQAKCTLHIQFQHENQEFFMCLFVCVCWCVFRLWCVWVSAVRTDRNVMCIEILFSTLNSYSHYELCPYFHYELCPVSAEISCAQS